MPTHRHQSASASNPSPGANPPRLYSEFASWWPLLSSAADYREEAEFFADLFSSRARRKVREVLELGSGGGNNASHLKTHFTLTLVDLSADMLAVSREVNPECEHRRGDMRSLRLRRQFDAIFVHDAVNYLLTEKDLGAAVRTTHHHCRPGGVAVFAPDHTEENFRPGEVHGGNDIGGRGMRFLQWTWDPDPNDQTYLNAFSFILRDEEDKVTFEHEIHPQGLFSRAVWMDQLSRAGFLPETLRDPWDRDLFIGRRRR